MIIQMTGLQRKRQSTAFDFFHALQLLLLDVGDDNPDDWPAE